VHSRAKRGQVTHYGVPKTQFETNELSEQSKSEMNNHTREGSVK